ncbi:MAG TPA: MoaD family protein [Synergistales bacterium]|jgi:molybdopterin synthase sulfur carrier subunit|nr:molybdopterin synthase sulfur carrier subunit [Synergistaceae bacterium]HPA58367.1 MoaD family protein [Synergistales bacterium]HQO83452.1 MoaD family protein [Synergistales bacterium]HQQ10583.1 MoaD family protein [Synergistales bacterium]
MIRVSFYGMVREIVGEKETQVEAEGSVADLLEALSGRYGMRFGEKVLKTPERDLDLILILNGRHIEHIGGLSAAVKEGDHLAVFPLVGGG